MVDLRTRYLGLELANPLVPSASPMGQRIDTLKERATHPLRQTAYRRLQALHDRPLQGEEHQRDREEKQDEPERRRVDRTVVRGERQLAGPDHLLTLLYAAGSGGGSLRAGRVPRCSVGLAMGPYCAVYRDRMRARLVLLESAGTERFGTIEHVPK